MTAGLCARARTYGGLMKAGDTEKCTSIRGSPFITAPYSFLSIGAEAKFGAGKRLRSFPRSSNRSLPSELTRKAYAAGDCFIMKARKPSREKLALLYIFFLFSFVCLRKRIGHLRVSRKYVSIKPLSDIKNFSIKASSGNNFPSSGLPFKWCRNVQRILINQPTLDRHFLIKYVTGSHSAARFM